MKILASLVCAALLLISCSRETPVEVPRYSAEQFYDNTRIFGGVFSLDESKLLVSSNESGIYNVYEISVADGSKEQRTFSEKESFFAVTYIDATGEIIYAADKGGDENSHLYLLKEDGSSVDLTPGEKEKVSFAGWAADRTRFYFRSNRRTAKFFDVYIMDTTNWESEIVFQNDDGLNVGGISKDGTKITLAKSISTSENQLFLENLETDERIEVSNPDKRGTYRGSGISKDGNSLFYRTDVDGEFSYLVEYDISNDSHTTIFESDWDVAFSYTSETEKYRVIAINEDGKNTLKVLDNETGEPVAMPDFSDGNVQSVSISRSETKMRLWVGSSRSPSDLYTYDFETKELQRLTNTLNPEIAPEHLAKAEVVRYASFDGLEIPSIFYKPLNASKENPAPALIWVHGGPGGQSRVGFSQRIQFLVNQGYAVLAVNNRGSSGYGKTFYRLDDRNHGENDLMDCIYGKKYLQTLDYIDGGKIGILGGSYGGFMTMAAMVHHPKEFEVGVNIYGVTNWVRTLKSIPPHWEAFKEALYAEMGDPNSEEDAERLHRMSPVFHGEKVENPVMVIQGANDVRVLQAESDDMVAAIRKGNVPVEYLIFPDEGHGIRKKKNQIECDEQILAFLDTYLRKSE